MNVQLAIDTAEGEVDRLRAQEELRRDLAIGATAGDGAGNAHLLRRELLGIVVARAIDRAGGAELGARLVAPQGGAEPFEDLEGLAQALARLDAAPGSMQA